MAKVDWTRILSRLAPAARKMVVEVRARHEDLLRQISLAKSVRATLDFGRYRAQLPDRVSEVEQAEKQISEFKASKLDTKLKIESLESERIEKAFMSELENEIKKLEERLEKLKKAKPVDTMTVDEIYEIRPDIRASFQEALKNDVWLSSGEIPQKEQHH